MRPTVTASLTKYCEGVFSETNSVTLMALKEFHLSAAVKAMFLPSQ